jgi:hypothetical protein
LALAVIVVCAGAASGILVPVQAQVVNTNFGEPNGFVFAIAEDPTYIYIGGGFTIVAGQPRNRIARFVKATGALDAWNPSVDAAVGTIHIRGGIVYIGGNFTTVNGTPRARAAALDATTGALTSWNPDVAGVNVNSIVSDGSKIYLGGNFTSVSATPRNGLAAVDLSGTLDPAWNPGSVGSVINVLLLDGTTLYVGGTFTMLGGASRNNLGAVSTSGTGAATPFDPNMNATVYALALSGTTLYAGGSFTGVNPGFSTPRSRLAAFSTTTSTAIGRDPGADSDVLALAISGDVPSGTYRLILTTSTSVEVERIEVVH